MPEGASRQAIEAIIRDYLLKHPEVVEESLQVLQQRRREAEKQRAREAVAARQEELLRDPDSPIGGNPRGDVTVVEFFDYRCPYCRQVEPNLKKLLEEDPNLRIVYKELPILGPESELAARTALAGHVQGRYVAFHDALMGANRPLTLSAILEIASAAGVDAGKLQADMEAPHIRKAIERNHALAQALGISGTPAFVIGGELVPGAVSLDGLRALIAKTRLNLGQAK